MKQGEEECIVKESIEERVKEGKRECTYLYPRGGGAVIVEVSWQSVIGDLLQNRD